MEGKTLQDNSLEPPTPIFYEEKLDRPSNYSKHQSWYDRKQYAGILSGIIASQMTQYKREKDRIKKTRIAQNIGYLVQVQGSLINSEKQLDERIQRLEERLGMRNLKN